MQSRGARIWPEASRGRPWCRLGVWSGLAAMVAGIAAGCRAPPQPLVATEVTVRAKDYDGLLDAVTRTLRRYDFAPQRVERADGLVVSQPTTSGQWFEVWRVDSRGGYQLLESSLDTMQRVATVRIEPLGADSDDYRIGVEVTKSRLNSPERQITTASGALAIFSEKMPTTEGIRASQWRGDRWVELGRDVLLENFLLDRIVKAAPVDPLPAAVHNGSQ